MSKVEWPAWRHGPRGEARVFRAPQDVPEGWSDVMFPGFPKAMAERGPMDPLDHDGDGEKGGSLPNNVPKLRGIAKAEGVDLSGLRKGDEIKAAILKVRAG